MSEQKLSDAVVEFVERLQIDGVFEVSLELVTKRWIPEIAALEAKLEDLKHLAAEAKAYMPYYPEMGERDWHHRWAAAQEQPADPGPTTVDQDRP